MFSVQPHLVIMILPLIFRLIQQTFYHTMGHARNVCVLHFSQAHSRFIKR
jgi:hypothetical protein